MRPLLLPYLRRLWRDPRTLQLGTDPRLATVLELADPAAAGVLELLDGTRSVGRVLTDAAGLGVAVGQARALLDALLAAGLIVDAHTLFPRGLPATARARLAPEAAALALDRLADQRPPGRLADHRGDRPASGSAERPTPAEILRRRAATRVLIAGHGPLAAPIAAGLAAAGVAHVDPAVDGWTDPADAMPGGLLPTDASRSRASATADAVRRSAPEVEVTPVRAGAASFVVRVGTRVPTALAARGVRGRTLPRLDVAVRDGIVVVGPLMAPDVSPCGRCLELHRSDRDPAWPALSAQLATARDAAEPCAVTTALAGAAYAVGEVLDFLDGRPLRTVGATVEVAGPGRDRRRSWPAHPGCDCRRRHGPRDGG